MMTREGFVAATKMAQKFGGKSLLRFFLHQVKLELAEKKLIILSTNDIWTVGQHNWIKKMKCVLK